MHPRTHPKPSNPLLHGGVFLLWCVGSQTAWGAGLISTAWGGITALCFEGVCHFILSMLRLRGREGPDYLAGCRGQFGSWGTR